MEEKVSDGTDLLTVGFLWTSDGIWSPMDETVSEKLCNYGKNLCKRKKNSESKKSIQILSLLKLIKECGFMEMKNIFLTFLIAPLIYMYILGFADVKKRA